MASALRDVSPFLASVTDSPTDLPPNASDSPLLLLVDGHSLAFRAYHAFAKSRDGGLRTSTGIPTSVCFGFLNTLLEVLRQERPQYAAVAFDLGEPTFRHQADENYKAGRAETPEDFFPDVHNLQQLLETMGLSLFTAPGYEADDIIGTFAHRAKDQGYRVKILSGDRDLFQLVDTDEQITVLYLGFSFGRQTGKQREFAPADVQEKLGVTPAQVVDFKALCGDSSDNIPGVKGIGEKTAVKLLAEYGSLENIYANLDQIKGAVHKRLVEGKEAAIASQYLAQIHLNVPIPTEINRCQLTGFDAEAVTTALKQLELSKFINQISQLQQIFGGQGAAPQTDSAAPGRAASDPDLDFFSAEDTDYAQAHAPQAIPLQPQIITTAEQLADLVKLLEGCQDPQRPVAWDTETTALDPRDAQLVGLGCCWGPELTDLAYIPVGHQAGDQLDLGQVLEALKPILESPDYPKALQNAKFDRLILLCQGITLAGVVFDPMLASYVLDPEDSHNLSDLSQRYLNLQAQSFKELVPKGKTIADIDIAAVAQYCGMDVYGTYHLIPKLQAELSQHPDLDHLFRAVELPLEPVLAQMEYQGVRINQPYLKTLSDQLEIDLNRLEQAAYEAAGETFNLASPKQLSELLFEKLGLDRRKSRKNKSGSYSTDAATLEKLQGDHPVVDLMVEHRTLSKLKSTYVDALPELVRADTQRIHADFNQAVTATGRLSSSNPNLQNIPIRTAFSRQIRSAFIPQDGWRLVAADYSQIELRILAHLSGEPVLLDAYRTGDDVHRLTARLLFEKDDISSEERRLGKVINFGVIYGMGASRFAREAGVNRSEAQMFIDRFNQRYPKVFGYLQQMQRQAISRGYVTTILGRRRYFNFTSNSLRQLQGVDPEEINLDKLRPGGYDAGQLRAAANAPIQGSSADIIKIAMIRLDQVLRDYQARLLMQVHDELVFELPPEEWAALEPQIVDVMESAVELAVPLRVEAHAGENWMTTK
jgi:DNA polymerase-1